MNTTKISYSSVILLCSLTLAACGGGGSDGGTPPPPVTPTCPSGQTYNQQTQSCQQNNRAPVVTSATTFSIQPDTPVGSTVYTATATDADSDAISWTLEDSKSIFSIASSTGVLQVSNAANLLLAKGSNYSIRITATDSKQAQASINITVTIAELDTSLKPVAKPTSSQAVVYYYRQDGDYSGWILHAWNNATCNAYSSLADDAGTDWATGLAPTGTDPNFGIYWLFNTKTAATCANFIVHKGDVKDPNDNDQKLTLTGDRWAFAVSSVGIFTDPNKVVFEAPFKAANSAAHWIDRNTLVWNVSSTSAKLVWSETAGLDETFSLTNTLPVTPTSLTQAQKDLVPHLRDWHAYRINVTDAQRKMLLKQQLALVNVNAANEPVSASYVQAAKALDDIYTSAATDANEQKLGLSYDNSTIKVSVWAPTAKTLKLKVYNADKTLFASHNMTEETNTGIWTFNADKAVDRKFYRFEIQVYHPLTKAIETVEATDPYSVNTSANGRYSQFVNMLDADLVPAGWANRTVPVISKAEDAVLLEAHVRDISIFDPTTSEQARGKYSALTETTSDATQYLKKLADSGVTHLHLLPVNDMANVDEVATNRIDLNSSVSQLCQKVPTAFVCSGFSGASTLLDLLKSFNPASSDAARLVGVMRGLDAFNWGYDPHHFNVVEGSYASSPEGVARIVEFRQMVQSVQSLGLRVVLDVVYNHTSSSGIFDNSVFDKLVPGYYHRYNEVTGVMERSTCCENTATEHNMMAKFVKESLVHWAEHYGVDGFRFDIMGHMPASLLTESRAAVAAIDPDTYFYGEGWNFGEVVSDRLFVQAVQSNLAGTEIGTFNDRPRDTIRAAALSQSSVNLQDVDHIQLGLAGTLQNYVLEDKDGLKREGKRFSQSSYALDPADIINYVDKHDNETLWDKLQYALPDTMTVTDRVRVHNFTAALPLLSQGIPFFQLGLDKLRSKSLDRNSYDSGDWFNKMEYSLDHNNWNVGLPGAQDNPDQVKIAALAANTNIQVGAAEISMAQAVFAEFLTIRKTSPLFRLATEQDVIQRVGFHNTGPSQIPGFIAMSLDDGQGLTDLDPAADALLVLINGSSKSVSFSLAAATGFELHQLQQDSADLTTRTATVTGSDFVVPAYTAAVFVKLQQGAQGPGLPADPDFVPSPYGDDVLYLTGLGAEEPAFEYDTKGKYKRSVTLAKADFSIKISNKDDVVLGFAEVSVAADSVPLSLGANNQINFSAATAGTYEVSLDITKTKPELRIVLTNALVSCAKETVTGPAPFLVAGGGHLYVRGSHSGWNPSPEYKLEYKGDNVYQAVANFNGDFEFKLASDDGSWTTQLWAQTATNAIETGPLSVGVSYPVAYKDAGTSNNRTSLSAGRYSFQLTLNSANPARGDNVGSLLIEQCAD